MKTAYKLLLLAGVVITSTLAYWWWQADLPEPQPKTTAKPTAAPAAVVPAKIAAKPVKTTKPPTPEPLNPIHLRFQPKPGQTLSYHFSGHSDMMIDYAFALFQVQKDLAKKTGIDGRSRLLPAKFKLEGNLFLKFYAYQPGAWKVAARIEVNHYQLNDKTPIYAGAVQYPFVFTLDALGRVDEFQFVHGIPREAKDAVQQVLRSMQAQLALKPSIRWQTKEKDGTGTYDASYTITDAEHKSVSIIQLQKQKQRYTSSRFAQQGMMGQQLNIKHSEQQISLQNNHAWVLNVRLQEQVDSVANTYLWSQYQYQFQAQRNALVPDPAFPDNLSSFLANMKAPSYRRASYYATDEDLNRLAQGLDLNGALEQFLAIEKEDKTSLGEKFLVNYLKLHPEAAAELIEILNGDTHREHFDENTQLRLWRLITEAEHKEAQQAVANVINNEDYEYITRLRAVLYSSSFGDPLPVLSNALWQLRDDLIDADSQDYQEMRTVTTYMLGEVAHQESNMSQQPSTLGQQLVKTLNVATTDKEVTEVLGSLGNYGGLEVLKEVEFYFNAQDIDIRAASYDAIRRVESPQTVDTFVKYYETETNPHVQQKALLALQQMSALEKHDAGMQWLRDKLPQEANPETQILMINVLGKYIERHPDNEQVLRQFLTNNLTVKVRRAIYQNIVPET
ncbi:HEAT repeat domain-containing protein [Candidatus Venteria ishoeyi]|uniref:Vitellogenin domain-containing protein n=1 Tax=Candidatus Venteria ishoeyi TaxID=1899563 RepID=A0A1H6F4M1_9GAMM|nr:HEAT repeat domain-containing protein [Candidatus Venteria ishoeyi]SEH05107.1 Uncharacterised protein [Candidatus Venteria ishoeyi]